MLRTLIIDDEEPARELIKNFLSGIDDIEIIGECSDGFSGVKSINEMKPDLVFLDIQMPKLTGFEVIELIDYKPLIVFATAYDQFAIKAFEANAVDYLLKPYNKDRLLQALEKARTRYAQNQSNDEEVKSIIKSIDDSPEILSRVAVKTGAKIIVLPIDSIYYFEAEGDYVKIVTEKSHYLKEKTMKFFETHLDKKQFVRIHRSYIVNVNEILRIEQFDKESHVLILKNMTKLRVSSTGYKMIKDLLNI